MGGGSSSLQNTVAAGKAGASSRGVKQKKTVCLQHARCGKQAEDAVTDDCAGGG